ncbi:uncharacterized protein F5Z01DRAFT_536340 [Emericellopsis atlantica]|uniref:Uncharacterized protein n=1 Tax=Emericellopsis atlantica TaxID=2614577 RepID=A0A9P7ZQZ9_9HYPO|nr:uncharacterized protein F5Z01DRAFT_536340 [Emericellopsis atlantica]KAG9256053.1 hypothetical protein F5Z01DRAFT_536340 [Emericellopsis atlantica]
MSQAHHPLHLFDLPPEILAQILRPLLQPEPPSPIPIISLPAPPTYVVPPFVLSVLLAHPLLYSLGVSLLYAPNQEFYIDTSGPKYASVKRTFVARDLLCGSTDALDKVRWLSLTVDRLRGWMTDDIVPVLTSLILHGSLERVDVYIHTDVSARHFVVLNQRRMEEGGPLRALLHLLADPDLRSGRLFIQRRHNLGWCRFHDKDSGEEDAQSRKWVEVRWQDVLRTGAGQVQDQPV